jgi:hypothetical protein
MQTSFKIERNFKPQSYGEISQTHLIFFSYATLNNGVVYPGHSKIKCRDFLLDTLIWRAKEAIPSTVYGYTFNGNFDNGVFLLENVPNAKNLHRLQELEALAGMQVSELYPTNENNAYVIVGDVKWFSTTVLLSLWTMLIRHTLWPETPDKEVYFAGKSWTLEYLCGLGKDAPRDTVHLKHPEAAIEGVTNQRVNHDYNGIQTYAQYATKP